MSIFRWSRAVCFGSIWKAERVRAANENLKDLAGWKEDEYFALGHM